MMDVRLLPVLLSLVVLAAIVELARRDRLTFKYAASWILAALGGIGSALGRPALDRAAAFFGFTLTSNFIFFTALAGFVFLTLLMTVFLCQQTRRNELLAQNLALLEADLDDLRRGNGDLP